MVAERYDLALADVFAALAYYHANPEEMREVERRRSAFVAKAEEMTTLTLPAW